MIFANPATAELTNRPCLFFAVKTSHRSPQTLSDVVSIYFAADGALDLGKCTGKGCFCASDLDLIGEEFLVDVNQIGEVGFLALVIGGCNFERLLRAGNESLAEEFKLFYGSLRGGDLAAELTTNLIALGFAAIDRATTLVCGFTDSRIDFVTLNWKCNAESKVDVVVAVGNGADNIGVVADDRVSKPKLKVRILLQTSQRLLCMIASNFRS